MLIRNILEESVRKFDEDKSSKMAQQKKESWKEAMAN